MSEITIKNIDAVLAFLPLFEGKGTKLYERIPGRETVYSDELLKFLKTLRREGLMVSLNLLTPIDEQMMTEAGRILFHGERERLSSADLPLLRVVLGLIIKTNEWNGDLPPDQLVEDGFFLALLRRLAAIRAAMASTAL